MTYEKELEQLKKRGVRVEMVRTFDDLTKIRDEFVTGHKGYRTPFLLVIGQPGVSKSHHFEKTDPAKYINNAASPVGLYAAAYCCKSADSATEDNPIILDDVDGLLTTAAATSFFKALGADRTTKQLSWEKQNAWLESEGIPRSYTTTSRLCILCNAIPKVKWDLQAVLDRAKTVIFSPTAQEIHKYVGGWWKNEHHDIYEYMGQNLNRIYEPSIRWYTDTLREKRLGNDWRKWLLKVWYDENPELSIVGEIKNNPHKFPTFEAQWMEFHRLTGLKRASYNLYLQKWKDAQGEDAPPTENIRLLDHIPDEEV